MKTYIFSNSHIISVYEQYEKWLEDNKSVEVVATSLFQRQLDTMNGTSMGHIYLLVTYK